MLTTTNAVFRGNVRMRGMVYRCLLICTLLIGAGCANAQGLELPEDPLAEPDRWLSKERWSELRYGLSIREPIEATRVPDTAQGDVIRWALPDGTRISMSFARGAYEGFDGKGQYLLMKPKVDLLKKQISDELRAMTGQVINTFTDQVVETESLAGVINYYVVKPDKRVGKPYFYGVALLQLDSFSVLLLRLESPPDKIPQAVSTFECMVQSILVQEAKDINKRLHGWLQNAEQLLAELTQDDRRKAMRADRLYRVVENGKDIGFTRVWQRYQDDAFYKDLKAKLLKDERKLEGIDRFEVEGNAVFTQMRLEGQGVIIQHHHQAIEAPGEPTAYWQTQNSLQYQNDRKNLYTGAWVETGIRGVATIGGERMDHIQLTREGTPPKHMVDFILERENDPERKLRYPSVINRTLPTGEVVRKLPSGEVTEKAWPTPNRAFLSPVDAALMPVLLPNEEKTYAFSAYHQDSSRIDFRLMRVEPTDDGGKTVYLRPVLDQSEQVLVFDANNELISHTYPDGRSLRKTTKQELAHIWGARLKD